MKLKSARIRNFKLLRDVTLDFSDDQEHPLTVIRAENASGKTSTLTALRWVLYGKEGLDDPNMRLSPTTWPDGKQCEISVQLDFSHTVFNLIAGETVASSTDYRLVRIAVETPEGDQPNRGADRPTLYRLTDVGLDKRDPPELHIAEILPPEMQNIFFTDGDAAMSFVSPQLTKSSKRDQVRDAIRSLLGLGLLEQASTHISGAQRKYNSEVSQASGSSDLSNLAEKINETQSSLDSGSERLRDVERQVEELARRYEESDQKLQLALQAGDFQELSQQKDLASSQLEESQRSELALKDAHRAVLQDQLLSLALLAPKLNSGFGQLVKLHDAGIIPSGSVPVLEERLEIGTCVCGTTLSEGSEAREHLVHLIERQRSVDLRRKGLTELHHAAKVDLQRGRDSTSDWINELDRVEKARLGNRRAEEAARAQLRICEEKISRIRESGVEDTRRERDSIAAALTAKKDEHRDLQTSVERFESDLKEMGPRYEQLRRQDAKVAVANARLTVTDDMNAVVRGALEDLQQTYLSRVSNRMNGLFLEMVGADPIVMSGETIPGSGSAVFKSAEISPSYEIIVNSSGNKTLNPDSELNGASKRALTFSFVWALTEVSQMTAPRIIDTPLGMMSGAVKKRVLELITAPPSDIKDVDKQVVLFLTRDEIRGIEDVIDSRAGRVFTLTNSDHYPSDLVNNPSTELPEVLKCDCNHRQFCTICTRKNDSTYGLVERSIA